EKQSLRRFSFCQGNVKADTHAFSSWGSGVLGLGCDGKVFAYDIGRNTLSSVEPSPLKPPMAAPSGNLFYYHGYVLDKSLRFVRALDIAEPDTHSSLGRNRLGQDVFNGAMYDPGPRGSGVGSLVSHNMTNGSSRVIIGPSAGFPYPPSATHVSSLAHKRPGWVFVSIVGNTAGRNLLDNEVLLANVDTGEVCRLGHHRSFGKNNTRLATPYWAEPHVSASPTASRALFASDWGNASSVDAYVFELPSYKRPSPGLTLTLGTDRTSYRRGQTMAMTLTLDNVGKGPDIDLYLAAIPPGGSSLFFFDNWSFHRTPANGARPATWPPIAPRVKMPHSFTLDLDSVYRKTWGAGDRTGTHQFLLFATRTGTLRDDRINGNDMVAVGTVLVQLTP
ncbi:MAG: hypothetical protein ACRD21_26370, partial [Vicinamibacteria bacterium]